MAYINSSVKCGKVPIPLSLNSNQDTLDCSPISPRFLSPMVSDIFIPKCHIFLFSHPSECSIQNSKLLSQKLEGILGELEDKVQIANVRDDSSIQPQKITLQSMDFSALRRRRTTIPIVIE